MLGGTRRKNRFTCHPFCVFDDFQRFGTMGNLPWKSGGICKTSYHGNAASCFSGKLPQCKIKFGMDTPMQIETASVADVRRSTLEWILIILPFAWLWFHLIDNLRLQWTTDPQYSYGLVVPLLTAGLLLRRWQRFSADAPPTHEFKNSVWLGTLVVFLILLYLPTRLIEEAVPEWRPIGWALAVIT